MNTQRLRYLLPAALVILILAAAFDAMAEPVDPFAPGSPDIATAPAGEAEAEGEGSAAEPAGVTPEPEAAPEPRLRGELPESMPTASLEQTDGSVAEALLAVTRQCGWGLVLSTPAEAKLTLHAKDRPADELVELILEAGGLQAELQGGLLKVQPVDVVEDDRDTGQDVRINLFHGKLKVKHGKNERVGIGESVRVGPGETVDEAVSVGGSVTVEGTVRREVVSIGGTVTLEPGSEVRGDAVAIGGEIVVKPGAKLEGDRVSIGGSLGEFIAGIVGMAAGPGAHPGHWILFGVLAKLLRTLVLFVIALLLVAFMPERLGRVRSFLTERPGASTLGGLALIGGFIPFCVLLAITVIGIPLIPVAVLLLVAMHIIGLTAFMTWLGDKVPVFKDRKSPVLAMFIGLVVIFLVDLIPIVGGLAVTIVAFVSGGAVLLSRFGRAPKAPESTAIESA